jgi:Asp-tRNA(Asn)/Glu-tRNA(Gln) amidotransferase A subunit family amidase
MMGIFEQVADAIITLSARGPAPQGTATGDPVFCSLWTLVGFPALNMPLIESAEGLPIGVQLIGAPGRDERLLRTARSLIASLGEAE